MGQAANAGSVAAGVDVEPGRTRARTRTRPRRRRRAFQPGRASLMLWLTIALKPWAGRYELDMENHGFTGHEWRWVKQHAGYLPLTVKDGMAGGDPDLLNILACIALYRAVRVTADDIPQVFEQFTAAGFGDQVDFENDQTEEDDAGPPVSSSNGNNGFSGDVTVTSSGPPMTPSGIPGSDTSVSDQTRSPT